MFGVRRSDCNSGMDVNRTYGVSVHLLISSSVFSLFRSTNRSPYKCLFPCTLVTEVFFLELPRSTPVAQYRRLYLDGSTNEVPRPGPTLDPVGPKVGSSHRLLDIVVQRNLQRYRILRRSNFQDFIRSF